MIMPHVPMPDNENDRIAALHALGILDSGSKPEFDALVEIASAICGTPISLVSLIDTDRQWFKANKGLHGVDETARADAFCAYTILGDDLFEVIDATTDPRFQNNPLVTGEPYIRLYAGFPIRLSDGTKPGTICIISREPGELSGFQHEILRQLATIAGTLLENRVASKAAADETLKDRLTPLASMRIIDRSDLDARLQRAELRCEAENITHTLLLLSVDELKVVNEACGHTVGELLLWQIGKILRQAVRENDSVSWLGDDRFAILLERCTPAQSVRAAQAICDRMAEFSFAHDGHIFDVSINIGVVPVTKVGDSLSMLLSAADLACASAKVTGRNTFHLWDGSAGSVEPNMDEQHWGAIIRQALETDRFELFAQRIEAIAPMSEGRGGVLAEVLLRMRGSDGTLVQPSDFLIAAERFYLASSIDRWVLGHAIQWLQASPNRDEIETLSVNLSAQSVGDRAFQRWSLEQVNAAGPDIARCLCFELSEKVVLGNLVDIVPFVEQMRAAGVKIAIDHFGTGATSFAYLKRLKVDILKIDGQFIQTVSTDVLDDAAVRSFADVAEVTGLKTVAECVETKATLRHLMELGIDYAQGFLLHRPVPIDELFKV